MSDKSECPEQGGKFERVLNGPTATIVLISSLNTDVANPIKKLIRELTTAPRADMEAVEAENAKLKADNAELCLALRSAGVKFLYYESLHNEKGVIGAERARENRKMADMCYRAIEKHTDDA